VKADAQAPATLERLVRDARALSASVRGVLGVEPDDLVSAGWLAYTEGEARGYGHAWCASRARFAMIDELSAIIGTPRCRETDAQLVRHTPLATSGLSAPNPNRATRTRLPRPVRRALGNLSEEDQAILRCAYLLGWSNTLCIEHFGWTPNTWYFRLRRALSRIRTTVGASHDTLRRTEFFDS
jgi:DNA-directed RNA polymerase specialized sigma24 family protein